MSYWIDHPWMVIIAATVSIYFFALVTEFTWSRFLQKKNYSLADSATNLTLYVGSLLIDFAWVPVVFVIFSKVHEHSLMKFGYQWWLFQGEVPIWHWLLLLMADDFCYYCFHRTSHRVWLFWASHENHHSSNYFNLSVAARQTWSPFYAFLFWLPLAFIGFDPLMILTMQFISLSLQGFLHTELIRSFGPFDWVFNSPSHHRVHHGTNPQYVDKNFGGIFIIWDRFFGTFEPEQEKVYYGIGHDLQGYHPLRAVSGEYLKLVRSLAQRNGLARWVTPLKPPGWSSNDK